ncbi:putative metal-binding motif-containing protein [Myxococcota bacterium]|nr:putative metal-binding motif-containing protein [Myxococcota bacterium]
MGKARVWRVLTLLGAAWGDAAWAQSCASGPVCVDRWDFDTLTEAVEYAQDAGFTYIEVTSDYDPAEESPADANPCATLALNADADLHIEALSADVRWPGLLVSGGALTLSGGSAVGACERSYEERVAEYDASTSTSLPVLRGYAANAQLIAFNTSVAVDGVTFDYSEVIVTDERLGALFLWDSSLDASGGTSVLGFPRRGAVEVISDDEDVTASFTEVSFSENQELALIMRLTLSASMERLDADGLPAEPRLDATLTGTSFFANSPGYGISSDLYVEELSSLSIVSGVHIGTGDGVAIYAHDTHVSMSASTMSSYERGFSVTSADGFFTGALDESDDVSLEILDSSFMSFYNDDEHGGVVTASSGDITLSGVTASDLSARYAPFVKVSYAPSLLIEDLVLTSFQVTRAPSAAIHAEQVDVVTLRRAMVCDGQSSSDDAGGGVALYVNGLGGPEQHLDVHNLAFWGNRFGEGRYPAAVYVEDVKYVNLLHSSFIGSDEPTGRDAYAVKLMNADRDRYDITNNLIQGLTKGVYLNESYEFSDNSAKATYNLYFDVDVPFGTGKGSYDLTTSYVNAYDPGIWAPFNPVDCSTPPLLGYGAFAIDKGDPARSGDPDGSLPDLGAFGGPYAWELPDDDGDGFTLGLDCDDGDPNIHPQQIDLRLDGVDRNCDGQDSPLDEPIYEGPGDDTGADDTGVDDTGVDDSGETPEALPPHLEYFGGRSCGGSTEDVTSGAALLFVALWRRRRPAR